MHSNGPTAFTDEPGATARGRLLSRRGEPLFYADWDRALFLHYEVDAAGLQREVRFPLDLREGRAYVSVVAFAMRGLRLRFGGRLGRWLCAPIATSDFLHLRTYVRHRGESGIYFLTEWLSDPLSVRLGPCTFGLPYRHGRFEYRHDHEVGMLRGEVLAASKGERLQYEAAIAVDCSFGVCAKGSLDEFLIERYTAFTCTRGRHRFFRIWHEPWRQAPVRVSVADHSLINGAGEWFRAAKLVGANYSPGARDVWMGWPHRIRAREPRRRSGRLSATFEMP